MRFLCATMAAGAAFAVLGGQGASAQGQPTADDLARAVESAPCPGDKPRGDDGVCPPDTRGFTLFPGASVRPGADLGPTSAHLVATSPLHDLSITFRPGSADIMPEGRRRAILFAQVLTRPSLSRRRFQIAGYTDASGSEPKNLALSQARAEAVRALLIDHGVAPSRLEAKGYGSSDLAVPENPRDPRNRRVAALSLD